MELDTVSSKPQSGHSPFEQKSQSMTIVPPSYYQSSLISDKGRAQTYGVTKNSSNTPNEFPLEKLLCKEKNLQKFSEFILKNTPQDQCYLRLWQKTQQLLKLKKHELFTLFKGMKELESLVKQNSFSEDFNRNVLPLLTSSKKLSLIAKHSIQYLNDRHHKTFEIHRRFYLEKFSFKANQTSLDACAQTSKKNISIRSIMANPHTLGEFSRFLEQRFFRAPKYLNFWIKTTRIAESPHDQLEEKITKILRKYISAQAPLVLLLPEELHNELNQKLEKREFSADFFSRTNAHVLKFIEDTYLPEYIRSLSGLDKNASTAQTDTNSSFTNPHVEKDSDQAAAQPVVNPLSIQKTIQKLSQVEISNLSQQHLEDTYIPEYTRSPSELNKNASTAQTDKNSSFTNPHLEQDSAQAATPPVVNPLSIQKTIQKLSQPEIKDALQKHEAMPFLEVCLLLESLAFSLKNLDKVIGTFENLTFRFKDVRRGFDLFEYQNQLYEIKAGTLSYLIIRKNIIHPIQYFILNYLIDTNQFPSILSTP